VLVDAGAVEEEADRVERDALTLAEGVHQLRQRRGRLALEEDLVAVLRHDLEVDVLARLDVLLVLLVTHGCLSS